MGGRVIDHGPGGSIGGSGAFVPETPFHMVWIATDLCNARCAHCSSNSSVRSPDELSTREACALMDQLADAGVLDLAISGGEPLLRRDLFHVIAHGVRRGLSVGVGSNGARLSADSARRLAACGVGRFQVSLDGLAPEHDALRRWSEWPNSVWRLPRGCLRHDVVSGQRSSLLVEPRCSGAGAGRARQPSHEPAPLTAALRLANTST